MMGPALVVLSAVLLAADSGVVAPVKMPDAFEAAVAPVPAGRIDKLVFANLSRLKVHPILCSDAVFVRRAYLDVIGTLPTAKETREFILDPDKKNKRRILFDRLLDRPEFADYWAMRWGDVLRIKAEVLRDRAHETGGLHHDHERRKCRLRFAAIPRDVLP